MMSSGKLPMDIPYAHIVGVNLTEVYRSRVIATDILIGWDVFYVKNAIKNWMMLMNIAVPPLKSTGKKHTS